MSASRGRVPWSKKVATLLSLCFVTTSFLFLPGCKGRCYWEVEDGIVYRVWPTERRSRASNDRYIGAFVTDNNVAITDFQSRLNGAPVATNTAVSAGYMTLIQQDLQNRGLYNPAQHTLWFFQSTSPENIAVGACGAMRVAFDGGVRITSTVSGLITNEADLIDGAPLSNAEVTVDPMDDLPPVTDCGDPIGGGVPLLPTGGLVVLVLLFLGGGLLLSGRLGR